MSFEKIVPQGLFRTLSHPIAEPGHERELNIPNLLRVIDPVSMAPTVAKIELIIKNHLDPRSSIRLWLNLDFAIKENLIRKN